VVSAEVDADHNAVVTVHNGTSVTLQGMRDLDGAVMPVSLEPDAPATISLAGAGSAVHRLHLQVFPRLPELTDAVTLLVSAEQGSIAGQAFVSEIA
jgi:hypothetical protein